MSRLLVVIALVACACAGTGATTTSTSTTPSPPDTTTTTESTQADVGMELQGCESPPTTFSPLCEIFELLETWYVDTPVDADALALLAVEGLGDHTTTAVEEAPRTLFCAIPHEAFTSFCDALVQRVRSEQLPVGPAVEAAMTHMVDFGLGPFTYYLPPELAGSVRANGIVGGIGVVLDARDAAGSKCTRISEVCELEIVVVLEDNPGAEAGLANGDIIKSVDGESVTGKGFTEVVSLISGDESGPVDLTVLRDGGESSYTIERSELSVPTVEARLPGGDVGYISIPDFELDVPSLVAGSLSDIVAESPGTIVVDLRDNPGGYIDAFLDIVDLFVDGGIVMTSESTVEYLEYAATEGGLATTERLLVLVNQGTASAAEVLAGALRDRRDAMILGTDTFGKDAVQIPFTLRNGGEFYVAVARWSTPGGDSVADGGLTPDVEVSWPSGATVEEIVELALEAAS